MDETTIELQRVAKALFAIVRELEGIRLALCRPAPRDVRSVAWTVGRPVDETQAGGQ